VTRPYLRRRGRITRGQARALEAHRGWILTPEDAPVAWPERFGREAPLGVEIGFGAGQALLDWAEAAPDMNLVGIDVYQPGIGALLVGREARDLENLLVIEGDAETAMEAFFESASVAEIRIFFPDPWPKKRHHKRRLIQKPFVALLGDRLIDGGRLRLATDWQPYAEWMLEMLEAEPNLENQAADYAERFEGRPVTRFEARGQRLGHEVWDLAYRRRPR
jgi:tRNA (guanine-N7-)-methyltransferase